MPNMRVARSAEPGTGTGETRKRERVDEGARKDRVPKPMRAVERKVMKGEDIFAFVCAAEEWMVWIVIYRSEVW
jgi:hypothetical protein